MIYVIDGHNLIGKLPDLSLAELDDEAELIKRLQAYVRAQARGSKPRKVTIEVFFDKAAPGHAGVQNYGAVHAHFVPAPLIADEAIRRYINGLGGAASNVTVVTSDRMVKTNARAMHAQVIPSEVFAQALALTYAEAQAASAAAKPEVKPKPAPKAAPASHPPDPDSRNLDQWLEMFGLNPDEAERPIEIAREKPAREKPARDKASPPKNKPESRPHHGFKKKP